MGIDKEVAQQLMYAVLSELSKSNLRIVFKGALLLSALMEEADILSPSRLSRDFDGDLQDPVSVEQVQTEIGNALIRVGATDLLVVRDDRTTIEQFFYNIVDSRGAVVFGVDIGTKINPWHTTYVLKNGTQIYGQTIAKIFWDKISVVSSPAVERRPWDVFDMYLLSLRYDLVMSEILSVRDGTGRQLGDFKDFLYPSDKLKSVWKRRRYIKDRPEFEVMFGRVRDLCMPFITEWEGPAEWKPKEGFWYEGEPKKVVGVKMDMFG